ncbi:YeeE/YedE family protein [uncultured Albimonas sp.]|uniref:YeeE/YedE family protein n=1 Tax=uncultured Albimonas sp. TaxID=1331701 RepID=UPI0030ECF160|tara:strand:+ start:1783 stop:2223 length:441 start_codon:yes stop_codon:yes gene_type:complete
MTPDWISGLLGGALIGAASGLLLLGAGRIAGVSGMVGGLIEDLARGLPGGRAGRRPSAETALFLLGLTLAPALYLSLGGIREIVVEASAPTLIVSGLLVGFGTRLGSGCTSGHGVCGAARLSRRSLAAMGVFMAAAVATVALGRLV